MNIHERIQTLIEKAPRLVSTDAQLVLREQYETAFGIYNHDHPQGQHPLALVMMNWCEDTVTGGGLHERMEQYMNLGILKYFGIPFDQWIEQPTYVIELQLDSAKRRIEKEAPALQAAVAALSSAQNT